MDVALSEELDVALSALSEEMNVALSALCVAQMIDDGPAFDYCSNADVAQEPPGFLNPTQAYNCARDSSVHLRPGACYLDERKTDECTRTKSLCAVQRRSTPSRRR